MAFSLDYVARETATNLRRNLLMSTAAILTVAVSLSLVGGALLLKQGVAKQTLQWRGGVELSIFLNADVTASQREAIDAELKARPDVRRVTYVDQDAAFEEFRVMFESQPDFLESVDKADLPPSFRVVPRDPEFVEQIGKTFDTRAGVRDVVYAKEAVETLIKVTTFLQRLIFAVAFVLLLSATLLILNTIRMAIFARRREVQVMKLVGATNWFIRIPFMIEGMIQGLLGAAVAFLVLAVSASLVEGALQDNTLFSQFVVSSADVVGTGVFILIVGAGVGAVGSGVAVSRFLDV